MSSNDTGFVADTIAQNSGIEFAEKAKLLCMLLLVLLLPLVPLLRSYDNIRRLYEDDGE